MDSNQHVYDRIINPNNSKDSLFKISKIILPNSTVLDLGTGVGALGHFLKNNKDCVVDGIEKNLFAIEKATLAYRILKQADLDNVDLIDLFYGNKYDYVVIADVLEHLVFPGNTLSKLNSLLNDNGRIILSIPNVSFIGVILELLSNEFNYRPKGLLDSTHLHFFTLGSIIDLLTQYNISLINIDRIIIDPSDTEFNKYYLDALPINLQKFLLSRPESFTYQFILEAVPTRNTGTDQNMDYLYPSELTFYDHPDQTKDVINKDNDHVSTQMLRFIPELHFTCAIYWRTDNQEYSEERMASKKGVIGLEHQIIDFQLKINNNLISYLRLDPADRPGFIRLHRMQLFTKSDECVWELNGDVDKLESLNKNQIHFAKNMEGKNNITSVITGDDPWIEIQINRDILNKLDEEGRFCLELSWPKSTDYLAIMENSKSRSKDDKLVSLLAELANRFKEIFKDDDSYYDIMSNISMLRNNYDVNVVKRDYENRNEIKILKNEVIKTETRIKNIFEILSRQIIYRNEEIVNMATGILKSRTWRLGNAIGDIYNLLKGKEKSHLEKQYANCIRRSITFISDGNSIGSWLNKYEMVIYEMKKMTNKIIQSKRYRFGRILAELFNSLRLRQRQIGKAEKLPILLDMTLSQIRVFQEVLANKYEILKEYDNDVMRIDKITKNKIKLHNCDVNIIICVHDALDVLRECINSVIENTTSPYRLVVVNDGSDKETSEYLERISFEQGALLMTNEIARGYTHSANQGLKACKSDYVVLLNSDTIVTPGWLDRLIACGESDEKIGAVGPLSNCASWQSIPEIYKDDGDWAENKIMKNITINELSEWVSKNSAQQYPRIPFLNGFCYMIKRKALEYIGYFDEENFGKGYCEENDYSLRLLNGGFSLAIADDTYVYHHQSRSYSKEDRLELSRKAGEILGRKHGQEIIDKNLSIIEHDNAIFAMRIKQKIAIEQKEIIRTAKKRFAGKKVAFVLPVCYPGGGANVVIQEAESMREYLKVDAQIINIGQHRQYFEKSYPNIDVPVLWSRNAESISNEGDSFDALIATANQSVAWLKNIRRNIIKGYYIQDIETLFYEYKSDEWKVAAESYKYYNDMIRFCKTEWCRSELKNTFGVDSEVVGPSVDTRLFAPRQNQMNIQKGKIRILAMIRFETPRRNPELTLRVLKKISEIHREEIEIVTFGCDPNDPRIMKSYNWKHAGVISREQTANLFSKVDIFVDFSSFQAMGLTALEAMACGVACIVPRRGGAVEFSKDFVNSRVVDTSNEEECLSTLEWLVMNVDKREIFSRQSILDTADLTPVMCGIKILENIFG